MNPRTMFATASIAIAAIASASLTTDPAPTPAVAQTAPEQAFLILDALQKQDMKGTMQGIARFDGMTPEYLDALEQEFAGLADHAAEAKLNIIGHMRLGESAVVIVHDRKERPAARSANIDIDPAYMIRQNGAWKIMPGFTRFEVPGATLGAERLEEMTALKSWFRSSKPALKKLVATSVRKPE